MLENLETLCYNCYFLYVADPLTQNQIRHIEDNADVKAVEHHWEVEDREHLDNMRALGIIWFGQNNFIYLMYEIWKLY